MESLDTDHLFFTSDTHFHHANIIRFCDRPFRDVEEQAVVFNYNQQRILSDSLHKYVWHWERERSWLFIWLADFLL